MKILIALIFTLLVASLSSYSSQTDSQRILDLETFEREVVRRQLERAITDARIVIEPNGTLSGSAGNKEISGKWDFRNGHFCRSFLVGSILGQEDCGPFYYDDNGITYIRQKSRGERVKFRFAK